MALSISRLTLLEPPTSMTRVSVQSVFGEARRDLINQPLIHEEKYAWEDFFLYMYFLHRPGKAG
jgi:hypothetical protein